MYKDRLNFKKEKVSIIIPSYNRKEFLDKCIKSIMGQSYKNKEVIVIDDHSNDKTHTYIKHKYPFVKVIRTNINKGPSFAKNQGAVKSEGEFLLFLDSDVELVKNDSILNMVRIIKENKKIGQIGGEINLKYPDIVIGLDFKNIKKYTTQYKIADKYNRFKKCDYITTSNCMIKRTIFYSLGGFDPYYIYPAEDLDLGYRLLKSGYHNVVCFDCGAVHKFSNISRLNRTYTYYRSKMRFLIKNFGIKNLLIMPLSDIKEGVIEPVISFIIKQINKKKIEDDPSIGPMESFFKRSLTIFFTPYCLLKGYLWNIANIKTTISSRNKNFLEDLIIKNNKEK